MKINFSSVLPDPLSSIEHKSESIWNSYFELDSKIHKAVLLNATSGKGKTTFTNLLIGLRHDYSGNILMNDVNIKSFTIQDWVKLRERKISFVHQDLQLFPNLTAWENIMLKNDLTQALTKTEIEFLLSQVELFDKKNQTVATLSMGQKQRIAIIRALCQPFDWIVLDEPFSHLDEKNTEICFDIIKQRCENLKSGLILTSLDPIEKVEFDVHLKL
jgi:ABC-type lipoprotein export system ATPase subunit